MPRPRGSDWYCEVIRLVARVAIGGRARVLAIDVTTGAGHLDMSTRQWERCIRVIERRRLPGRCVVTDSAVGWEP
jgi:hypothetical protein